MSLKIEMLRPKKRHEKNIVSFFFIRKLSNNQLQLYLDHNWQTLVTVMAMGDGILRVARNHWYKKEKKR